MALNQPNNNEQAHDSWWRRNNRQINNFEENNNKNVNKHKVFCVDDIFRNIRKKINILRKDNRNGLDSSSSHGPHQNIERQIIGIIIAFTIIIWAASGFYTIEEAERGVVTRLGKFSHLVNPGLNWKPTFIDDVIAVNVESVRELTAAGAMLTSDENVVHVEMNVQYRVTNPKQYLFSLTSTDESLRQATDSALRGVIGKYTMDSILTEDRTIIRNDTQHELEDTIRNYNMGIALLDVNFQAARPPEEVKAAFDDVIAARENEQQYIREAEAYINEVQPRANGKAQRILEEARAYKAQIVLKAQGEVERFALILPKYKSAPQITCKRLYIETMEKILSQSRKLVVSNNNREIIVLPIDQIIKNDGVSTVNQSDNKSSSKLDLSPLSPLSNNSGLHAKSSSSSNNDIMDQRRANARRNNYQRQEK